jgi:hypothetical protein
VSFILRCDAPACPSKAVIWGALPVGWTQTHNRYGDVVHACATVGHVAAAQTTTGRVATATIT